MPEVEVWLTMFVALYFMNPLLKLLRLMYNLKTMFSKSKPDGLKKFGEWAVVTGATGGIGKEFAKEFARRDLNLVLIGKSIEKLNKTKDEIQIINLNIQIKVIVIDFNRGMFEFHRVHNELEDIPVGILVNNVGVGFDYPMYFEENTESKLWEFINVNIAATILTTRLVVEDMKKRGKEGAIINICSGLDEYPTPLVAVYAASKTFVRYFTEAIRDECANYGLTVQALSPFYVDTKLASYSSTGNEHTTIFPNPEVYVKSAIRTLGKLDSTSGYWVHEVIKFFMSLLPMAWRRKLLRSYAFGQKATYLRSMTQKVKQIKIESN